MRRALLAVLVGWCGVTAANGIDWATRTARTGTRVETGPSGETIIHDDGTYRWPGVSFGPAKGGVWDLSGVGSVEVTVSNCCETLEMIHVTVLGKGFGTDRSPARSALTPPHQVRKIAVPIADAAYLTDVPVRLTGMRGAVGSVQDRLDFSQTTSIDVYLTRGGRLWKSDIAVLDIRTRHAARQPQVIAATNFFPFVDRYGQFRHGEWPGKVHSDADLQAFRRQEEAWLDAHRESPIPDADQYGGWRGGSQLKATGFFRTEKVDGKWWLVDPEGRLFFSLGVTCVYADTSTPLTGRENYFDSLPVSGEPGYWRDAASKTALFNFCERNELAKYGRDWKTPFAETAQRRFRAWGVNTIGNWSHRYVWELRRTPYVATVDTHRRPVPDAADPRYASDLRRRFARIADAVRDDPWCVGVFVDNELDWTAVTNVGAVAEAYFSTVRKVCKEMLPNHLYLGCRFARAQDEVWRIASRHCDVVSYNFYERHPTKDLPAGSVDKPLIVGEFHFGARDRGLLNSGCVTAFDQAERAQWFNDFADACLDHPRVVGCHWFQYTDQALTGRPDGENYQIGFVSVCDVPYPEMVKACRRTAAGMYGRRLGRGRAEADRFIASMPAGRQAQQARAVREAIRGNRAELDAIRRSRDIAKPLIAGVTRRMVREDLCLYLPESGAARETLVYLHGGCWTFGSINSCSEFCMAVAREGVAVLAYAYPLAPENDAQTIVARTGEAVSWAMEHASAWGGSPDAVAIGGDSAGGNLALAVALSAPPVRRPSALLLYYPVVHAWADEGGSWARYGKGFGLDADLMDAGNEAYSRGDMRNPLISPDCASDAALKDLPPCLFLAAGRDILLDQGLAFHRRLLALGVPTAHEIVPGATHLFVTVPGQPTAFATAVRFAVEGVKAKE